MFYVKRADILFEDLYVSATPSTLKYVLSPLMFLCSIYNFSKSVFRNGGSPLMY